MSDRQKNEERKGGVGVVERTKDEVKKPRMYRVLLHDDDFTPIEFVVGLVKGVFRKSDEEAVAITMQVHKKGIAHAGTFTHEIAETKVAQVHLHARQYEYPLMSTMESE